MILFGAVILTRFGTERIEFTSLRPIMRLVLAAVPGNALVAALVAVAVHYLAGDPGFIRVLAVMGALKQLGDADFHTVDAEFPFPVAPSVATARDVGSPLSVHRLYGAVPSDFRPPHGTRGVPYQPTASDHVVPFLLWAAIRTNLFAVSVMAAECAAFSFIATVHGNGPFAAAEPDLAQAIVMAQLALLAWPVCGYIIAAVLEENRSALQALLEANEFNNHIISNVQDGIIVMDLDLRYRVWSPGMERMRGLMASDVLGKTPMELFPFLNEAGVVELLERARAGETISTPDFAYEVPQTGRKGWNWGIMGPLRSADGQITGVIVTVREITDRIRMQELAVQSEKMLSIGGLAAGMAHELNNPLAVMVQNADVILQRISKDSPQNRAGAELAGTSLQAIQAYMNDREILQMLQGIHRCGERAAYIVKSMLAFSRPRAATMSSHRLDELINQAIELMHNDYELMKRYHQNRVEMIREFDDTLGPVPCHGSELQQVLLNLFSNAVHACAAGWGDGATSRIVIRTLREANHATITVADNGIGMPESVRRRVFEPFFTTKSPGEGTGLGLFLSYFIITHHHSGTMRVNPNPAGGTCFEISLPLDGRKPGPFELKQR